MRREGLRRCIWCRRGAHRRNLLEDRAQHGGVIAVQDSVPVSNNDGSERHDDRKGGNRSLSLSQNGYGLAAVKYASMQRRVKTSRSPIPLSNTAQHRTKSQNITMHKHRHTTKRRSVYEAIMPCNVRWRTNSCHAPLLQMSWIGLRNQFRATWHAYFKMTCDSSVAQVLGEPST